MISSITNQRNKRIAKNTILLYVRMLITMGVSLYSVRLVINTLGINDYGLYNVIGGVVALLSFLPGSMASATQRFFSFALGQEDQIKLNKVFGVNSLIYVGIGLVALFFLLTGGVWFIENKLKVPEGRLESILTLYYFSVFTFILSIIKSPMMATIIAHEDMKIYAYLSILESILKLLVVFLLSHLPGDKVVIYGILLFLVSILDTFIYSIICFKKYDECKLINIKWDSHLAKEILGFTGWTLFGQLTTVTRGAAITVLLNQYFSPVIIAARTIAMNISSQSNMLSTQFNTSLYPPIIKAYASNERKEMFDLVINGSKATFFLMWILALPLLLMMEGILNIWLNVVPEFSVLFAKLSIIEGLIFAISLPLTTAARAPGKMGLYESILGAFQLSILVFSWVFVINGFGPEVVFFIAIVVNVLMFFVRLLIIRSLIDFPLMEFLKEVFYSVIPVVLLSAIISLVLISGFSINYGNLVISICIIFTVNIFFIYFLGLPLVFRNYIKHIIFDKFRFNI